MTPKNGNIEEPEFVERRKCADEQCQKARTEWVENTLWPKIRIQMAMMIGGTVVFCTGAFLYLSQNAIRDYDLVARDRYISQSQHSADMNRIETKITKLEDSVTEHLTDLRKMQDRILEAVRAVKK